MENKKSDEMIEKMAKAKCAFPNCGKKQFVSVSMPVIKIGENNKPVAEEGMNVAMPVCEYHFWVVGCGMFVALKHPEDESKFMLHGPVNEIMLMEKVVEAMVWSGKIDELKDQVTKAKLKGDMEFSKVREKYERKPEDKPEQEKKQS